MAKALIHAVGLPSARSGLCVAALIIALAACTTTSGSYCQIAKPQTFSDAVIDQMSDAEVERALAELEKHRRLCGK